jgi:hypothetical protein
MPSTKAPHAVTAFELLKNQHKAYFPIVNDPHLLVEYVLDFFGPEGSEPLLTPQTLLGARALLLNRCQSWSAQRKSQGKKEAFVEKEADYDAISAEDLKFKVNLILQVIEDPEHLLGYISRVFGPSGPEGLGITDEATWSDLDDLFLCRMPYPTEFPEPESHTAEPIRVGLYRNTYARGEIVETVITPPVPLPNAPTTQVIEPEVLPRAEPILSVAMKPVSAMEIAGWCALGVGAVLFGGVAIKSLGRSLASPAGVALADEFATTAFMGLLATAREVFKGPRGGKYTVTSNGTKSYNVP